MWINKFNTAFTPQWTVNGAIGATACGYMSLITTTNSVVTTFARATDSSTYQYSPIIYKFRTNDNLNGGSITIPGKTYMNANVSNATSNVYNVSKFSSSTTSVTFNDGNTAISSTSKSYATASNTYFAAAYITKYTADYGTYGNTVPMAIDSSGSVKLSGSMNVASLLVGSIKGPYSNDTAASSGGVPIKGVYYDSSGIIHVRLT